LKVVFPLVDEYLGGLSNEEFQTLVQDPTKFFRNNQPTVSTCFGHVISFGSYTLPFIFDPHNFEEFFSSFKQPNHLKSLDCVIDHYEDDNIRF